MRTEVLEVAEAWANSPPLKPSFSTFLSSSLPFHPRNVTATALHAFNSPPVGFARPRGCQQVRLFFVVSFYLHLSLFL